MKGKNFSTNNASGKRKKSDFYETPYSITQQFLDCGLIDKDSKILEPACGDGAIVKVLKDNGFVNVTGKDLSTGSDFLLEEEKYDVIITNPPFSLALEFILKAKELCDKFVYFLPWSYIHGKERYDKIYTQVDFPLSEVYVFTRYPLLGEKLRSDGKYHTGMMVYAWYVWDKNGNKKPEINWLDNNNFILKAGE
jgi:hypothetical protein